MSFRQDIDGAPLLEGLPDDRCPCRYLPPGHVPVAEAGSELVQFSPSDELRAVDTVMMQNMQEMQGGGG